MFVRAVIRVVTVMVVIASLGGMPPGGVRAQSDVPLDLTAFTLRPSDLPEPGWTHDGAFMESLRSLAIGFAAYWADDTDAAAVQTRLTEIGWQRMYIGELSLAGSDGSPRERVRSYVTQYASAAGAAQGFAYLENESFVASASDVPGSRVFGVQSEITRDSGKSAVDGRAFWSLDLTFRSGALVAGVTLIAYADADAAPTVERVEALAATMEQRLSTDPADDGLGVRVMRFDDGAAGITTYEDAYLRLSGVDIPLTGEAEAAATTRTGSYGAAGDVYQLWQGLEIDGDAGELYGVTLLRFADDTVAREWLADLPETLGGIAFYGRLQVLDDVGEAEFTQPAVAMRYVAGGGSTDAPRAALIAVQLGSLVLRVHLVPRGRSDDVPLSALIGLARKGIACANDGACAPLAGLPDAASPSAA